MNTDLKTDVEYQYNTTTNENILLSVKECRQYKLDRFEFRNNIIDAIKTNNIAIPHYHIIITYYNQYKNRDTILKKHRYIRNYFEEVFNPRYRGRSDKSSVFFFTEKHKCELKGGSEELILDTITNREEYDDVNKDIVEGAYHSHILKSEIPDYIILSEKSKMRKLLFALYGREKLDSSITSTELQKIKIDLIKRICRSCIGVGNSDKSLKVVVADKKYYYDNYYGWEGYIAYATKKCYSPYMMMDVVDNFNSSISLNPKTIKIKEALNKQILRGENE
jgi:hypothetical protein